MSERTNLWMVTTLCGILDRFHPCEKGHYAHMITFVLDRPGHNLRFAIDLSRIRSELGWKPWMTV